VGRPDGTPSGATNRVANSLRERTIFPDVDRRS
jgi:hypothetical protein